MRSPVFDIAVGGRRLRARRRYGRTLGGRIDEIPSSLCAAARIGDFPNAAGCGECEHRVVKWTILIVDDHPSFRRFARRLLEADGLAVVGEAGDGASALATFRALRPQLVLLDILLPDQDGFAVAEALARESQPPVVILTSSREASDYGTRLERTSARGFIGKNELSGPALAALVDGG